jgi:glycine cleavage system H protein
MSTVVGQPKRGKQARTAETLLRFTDDHLWLRIEDGQAQLGLSDYGQNKLGEIIAVELPEVGESVERGDAFGELESVRTVQELTAPVSGTVTAVNADIEEHPELVNEDPYHEGWLIEIKLESESELEDLLPPDEYEDLI